VLEARYMRGDFFNFAPSHKLMLIGNAKPALGSGDEAMRRRLILLPFTVTVPEQERDPELGEKLKAEWPAILRWMIDGCLQWQQQGLTPPPSVAAASAEYLTDQDTLALWLDEKTISGNASDFTATKDLFASWQQWCKANNEHPGRLQRFTEALQNKHIYKSDRTTLENGKRVRGFYGLRLIDMFQNAPGRD
jgi:putative DNA primase/helicase